jgi:NADH-ubiquinone oxidoreductase chain 4
MLISLLLVPIIGSIIIFIISNDNKIKQIGLIVSIINFIISLIIWLSFDYNIGTPQFLIGTNIGIDGISLVFVLLTTITIPITILASWSNIKEKIKFFIISLLLLEAVLIGVFIVLDILIFYICFESSLIPLFFLIGIYGSGMKETKIHASYMLFLYTLVGSLCMLLAIITLYSLTGTTHFLLFNLYIIDPNYQKLLWLAFFFALAIKTPLIPFHLWLVFAHTEAPLAGSIILAGIQLKLAIYGFIKINIGLLPEASEYFTPLIYTLSIISIIYSSLTTLRQIDIKTIIAYSSIGHISIALLGIFSNNISGISGGIFLSIAHGITSPALFILVTILYERTGTRILNYYRGLSIYMPLFSIFLFIFTLANMGTPLTANFIGEILSFIGSFKNNPILTIFASFSIILSAAYSIWLYNRICYGQYSLYLKPIQDINRREYFLLLSLLILLFIIGIFPNILLDILHLSVSSYIYNSPCIYKII